MHIPDAPPALAPLLRRLYAEAETEVTQHAHSPAPDEWYAGRTVGTLGGGDFGPYPSAEDAIVATLRRLWAALDDARDERDRAEAEARELAAELAAVREQARAAAALVARLAEGEGGRRGA